MMVSNLEQHIGEALERHIGETMAEVLRERIIELETLAATRDPPEDTVSRLAFVRKMLVRFDARDASLARH